MTVAEYIDKLMAVEDKSREVVTYNHWTGIYEKVKGYS